jgi:DnaJ-domain-containing protein 1
MFPVLLIVILATLGMVWLVKSSAERRGADATKMATFMTCGVLLGIFAALLLVRGAWALAIPGVAGALACLLQYQKLAKSQRKAPILTTTSGMSLAEARAVLGLQESATLDEIKAAHRKLIDQLHPDKGGTDYLAAQINAAKDTLLKGMTS